MPKKLTVCRKCGKKHRVEAYEAVTRLVCRCGGRLKLVKKTSPTRPADYFF